MSNKAYNMVFYFIQICAKCHVIHVIPYEDCRVTNIFWVFLYSWYVTLIRGYILRIIINETHGCIWHAAPMSELKEELEHHTEHCQMFNHHIMVIGVFIAWVRHPSILFTFILRRRNAFIISVIVVVRRSTIFKEHFLWHLIAVGQIYIHAPQVSSMWCCPNGHISIYKPWLTRLSFVHHSLTWW